MRVALVALTSLSVACSLFRPSCPDRAKALAERLAAQEPFLGEVDPWARPGAVDRPVGLQSLPGIALPYNGSVAAREVDLDPAGQRYVDGTAIGAERAALCAALGPAPDGGHLPVRVHADAAVRGTAVAEVLADLHSCRAYRIDIVLRRSEPPLIPRSGVAVPPDPPDCPIDRARVAAAPPADRPARLAEALVAAQEACGCPLQDEEVVAMWQAAMLPDTFVTALPVRPSPSATPFEFGADETWQEAAPRLVAFAGPAPFSQPAMLWVANEGSLVPADEVFLPPPGP